MSELLTLQKPYLKEMGALGNEPLPAPLHPAPDRSWQKQFGRLTTDLCGGKEALASDRYALCPNKLCGKMMVLHGLNEEGQFVTSSWLDVGARCARKVLTEVTEWPLSSDRPEWRRDSEEPTCGALLTKSVDSAEPLLVYTYRSLKTSLAMLLDRPGLRDKCELWRSHYGPDHKRLQEFRDTMSDVWDGQL